MGLGSGSGLRWRLSLDGWGGATFETGVVGRLFIGCGARLFLGFVATVAAAVAVAVAGSSAPPFFSGCAKFM
jgi:hypothetical protein